jgi:small conductance mechanosensitive channel
LGTNILDRRVALSLLQQWMASARQWAVEKGPNVILRVVVLLVILALFKLLATLTRRVLRRLFATSKVRLSLLAQDMLLSVSSKTILALGLLVGLSQLGVSLGPVLAGLGVAGFILGFALQESLSNFAAGAMILFYRPFDVGDMVEAAGVFGRVSSMSLVSTTILTFDNQTLIVPNRKIWGDVIKNVTAQTTRRVDMEFGISYADDIPHAERVLREILEGHDKVLGDPEPIVKLHKLGESSVDFVVRPWVRTADYWDVYWDVTREVKMRFDREGITIPFPQRDVHVQADGPGEPAPAPPGETSA